MFVLRETPTGCAFPGHKVPPGTSSPHHNKVVILSGARRFLRLPRIGLRTVRIATRSRRIPPGKGSRASIPPPHRNSSRICTYKIAELTPLESALVKKERRQQRARAGIILNFRLSTANYQLTTTPLE